MWIPLAVLLVNGAALWPELRLWHIPDKIML
jgi:hypothetical protein